MKIEKMPNKLENKIYDGYSYIFYKETEDSIIVRCKYYQTHSCKGAGTIQNNVFTLTAKHNHSAESTLVKKNDLKQKLKEACRTQFRSTNEIFNNIITAQEDGFLLSWSSQKANMYNWHLDMKLPSVSSINEFSTALDNPKYAKLTHHEFGELKIQCSLNFQTVYLHDQVLFDKLLENEQNGILYFGSTQETIPPDMDISQCLTCVIPKHKHSFSFGWAIIADQTIENYNFFIEKIKTSSVYNWNQKKIFYNFDNKLYNSLSRIFPTSEVQGTFRAHCIIILQQIKLLNIAMDDDLTKVIVRKLLALSLLPQDKIKNTFLQFISHLTSEMFIKLQPLLNYYYDSWIQIVGVDRYSFHNNWDSLNDSDYANWRKLSSISKINNNIWTFIREIFNYTIQSHKHLDSFDDANNHKSQTFYPLLVRCNIEARNMKRSWRLLDDGTISEHDFLCFAASAIETFINDLIFLHQSINPDPNFEIVQHHAIVPGNFPMILPCCNENIFSHISVEHLPANNLRKRTYYGQLLQVHNGHLQYQEKIFLPDQHKCIICFTRYVTHLFWPCRHAVICKQCLTTFQGAANLRNDILSCPVCRRRSLRVDRIN